MDPDDPNSAAETAAETTPENAPSSPQGRRKRPPKNVDSTIPRGDHTETIRTQRIVRPKESRKGQDARIKREDRDHTHHIWRESILFGACLILIALVAVGAFVILVFHNDDDLRRWATTTLSSLITGILGYLVGRKQPAS